MASEDDGAGAAVERFPPTSGRVTGVTGLVVVVLVLVVAFADAGSDVPPGLVAGCVFAAVVVWAVMLRPAVRVEDGDLVLRGVVDTRWVPLAAIDRVAVASMLVVTTGGERYTCTGVGRSRRQSVKDGGKGSVQEQSYGGFVESRLKDLVERARLRGETPGAVRREWAWPEIVGLVVTGLATLVLVLL